MVRITHNPIKEIVVFEIISYDTLEEWEEKFLPVLAGGHQVRLKWTNGVLFDYNTLPPSEIILKNRLKGTLYIDALHYVIMLKYQPSKTIEPKEGGRYTYIMVDVSKTTNLVELAKWIKEYDKARKQ